MAEKLYRVVQATWEGGKRVEKEIGCDWKKEGAAKAELRILSTKEPTKTFSIQPQIRTGKGS